jgi:hypothetical protein
LLLFEKNLQKFSKCNKYLAEFTVLILEIETIKGVVVCSLERRVKNGAINPDLIVLLESDVFK